jgi:hypothetical protein
MGAAPYALQRSILRGVFEVAIFDEVTLYPITRKPNRTNALQLIRCLSNTLVSRLASNIGRERT